MKTILTSTVAGSLLAMLATAQPTATAYGRHGLPQNPVSQAANIGASAGNSGLVYVITGGFQFGAVDLHSGTFVPIGPVLPGDVGTGLVPGLGTSLLSLAFNGDLAAINPFTGVTSVIGPTGLHDCSLPTSPFDQMCANVIGRLDGTIYATDFANRLYSVDPKTGAAKLIGPTGIPPLTFVPFSPDPKYPGSVDVYDESLFSFRGKLYAIFGTAAVSFEPFSVDTLMHDALYEVNPSTGATAFIALLRNAQGMLDVHLSSVVNVNDTIYGFDAATGDVVTLSLTHAQTTAVAALDPAVGVVTGATPAAPNPAAGH
jgi:hypothetical protein